MTFNRQNARSLADMRRKLGPMDLPGQWDGVPIEDIPFPCTCLWHCSFNAELFCERCPEDRRYGGMWHPQWRNDPNRWGVPSDRDQEFGAPIMQYDVLLSYKEDAICGWEDTDMLGVPEGGDTNVITDSWGTSGGDENCYAAFEMDIYKNMGDCVCCGSNIGTSHKQVIHRVVVADCDKLFADGHTWDWDGRGAEGLLRSLMKSFKLKNKHRSECCDDTVDKLRHGGPKFIYDSLPIDDMAKSFQLAWDGDYSEVKGNKMDGVIIKPKSTPTAGTNRGRFVLKGSAGLIQYYKGDVVTFAGKTYSVLEDVKGKHPSNDSSFLLIEDKNAGTDGGIF